MPTLIERSGGMKITVRVGACQCICFTGPDLRRGSPQRGEWRRTCSACVARDEHTEHGLLAGLWRMHPGNIPSRMRALSFHQDSQINEAESCTHDGEKPYGIRPHGSKRQLK